MENKTKELLNNARNKIKNIEDIWEQIDELILNANLSEDEEEEYDELRQRLWSLM